jgi:hypothetical protein
LFLPCKDATFALRLSLLSSSSAYLCADSNRFLFSSDAFACFRSTGELRPGFLAAVPANWSIDFLASVTIPWISATAPPITPLGFLAGAADGGLDRADGGWYLGAMFNLVLIVGVAAPLLAGFGGRGAMPAQRLNAGFLNAVA